MCDGDDDRCWCDRWCWWWCSVMWLLIGWLDWLVGYPVTQFPVGVDWSLVGVGVMLVLSLLINDDDVDVDVMLVMLIDRCWCCCWLIIDVDCSGVGGWCSWCSWCGVIGGVGQLDRLIIVPVPSCWCSDVDDVVMWCDVDDDRCRCCRSSIVDDVHRDVTAQLGVIDRWIGLYPVSSQIGLPS